MIITEQLSKQITLLNSLCIILIVIMHSVIIPLNPFDDLLMIILFDNITRIAVPLFFLISSILFFRNFHSCGQLTLQEYSLKIKSKIHSLVVPYFITISIYILFYYITQQIPILRAYYPEEKLIEHQNIFSLIWNINPTLWFLRDLFIIYCFSPVILLLFEKKPISYIYMLSISICWMLNLNCHIECVFFISLGLLITKETALFNHILKKNYISLSLELTFVISLILRTYLLFFDYNYPIINLILLKLLILSGIIFAYHISYHLLNKNRWIYKGLISFSRYSFFVYLTHMFILHIIRNLCYKFIPLATTNLLTYLLTVIFTILLAVLSYKILHRFALHFLTLMLGGRIK